MIDRKKYIEEVMDGNAIMKRKLMHGVPQLSDAQNITPSQWMVLSYIAEHDGKTTKDVAEVFQMTGSAVTQLVNGLVEKGFIKREVSLEDRRASILVLSPDSRKQLTQHKKKRIDVMLKMFKVLTDDEFEQYVHLHKKVLATLLKSK